MKLKPKKLIKSTMNLFSMTGKKGRKVKSLFVVGYHSSNVPSFKGNRARKRKKNPLW